MHCRRHHSRPFSRRMTLRAARLLFSLRRHFLPLTFLFHIQARVRVFFHPRRRLHRATYWTSLLRFLSIFFFFRLLLLLLLLLPSSFRRPPPKSVFCRNPSSSSSSSSSRVCVCVCASLLLLLLLDGDGGKGALRKVPM